MKKLLIVLLVLFIICGCDRISFNDNLVFEINSNVTNSDLIKDSEGVTLIEPQKNIDTSILGNKDITISYLDKKGNTNYKNITIKIIDTVAPIIDCKDNITTTKGKEIDLNSLIKVTDNSKEEIKYEVAGKYNINILGDYPLKIIATDSSGNLSMKNITLTVKEITVKTKGYYIYKPKSIWEAIKFTKGNKVEEDLVLCPNKGCGLYSEYGTYSIKDKIITIKLTSYEDESSKGKVDSAHQCTIKSENKIVCDGKTYKWSKKIY